MASDMTLDSQIGAEWYAAVEEINSDVDALLKSVSNILQELGASDVGGTIGELLIQTGLEYVDKFRELVESFNGIIDAIQGFLNKGKEIINDIAQDVVDIATNLAVHLSRS